MYWHRAVAGWLLIFVFACSLSGCATIVSDRKYQVTMDNSGGATCFSVLDHKNRVIHSGVTPQQVTLKSSSAPFRPAKYHVVYAGQDGAQQHDLNARVDWWIAGNVVIGGVPGVVVDGASGAMWRLQPRVTGHVPAQSLVVNRAQADSIIAKYTGYGGPSTADVTTTVRPARDVRQASFDNSGLPGQSPGARQPGREF